MTEATAYPAGYAVFFFEKFLKNVSETDTKTGRF